MIQSAGKLSEILNFLLNYLMEGADEGMISGFLAVILRSAVKFEGKAEVLEVLMRTVSTDEERELVSTIVRSASLLDSEHVVARLLEKLLVFTTDTVHEEGHEVVPQVVEDVVASALESRRIADMVISELLHRGTVENPSYCQV